MKVNAVTVAMLDIPPEFTEEYNRWYDLDHLPEHISKGDVLLGRRYVGHSRGARGAGVMTSEWTAGHPPYLTIYSFGGPLDFESEEARNLWRDKDRIIVKAGRYWREGRGVHNSRWRLAETFRRPSLLVDDEAVPYLAHKGVIIALGQAPSPERRQEALDWWSGVHLVDLFAVPGILAAIRFDPVAPIEPERMMHLLYCEDDPADVMAGLVKHRRYQQAIGRYPAHGDVYEPIALLPFQTIVPFEYDFDFGDPSAAGSPGR